MENIFRVYFMRIINNTDINNLILYAKKNLGIYKLVYRKYKNIYWTSVSLMILSIVLLVTYILLSNYQISLYVEYICFLGCLLACLFSLYSIHKLDTISNSAHLKIQGIRLKLLKQYYEINNFKIKDIKTINEMLSKRIEKIERQKITIVIILGVLVLPIWDSFIQHYLKIFTAQQLLKIIVFTILISFVVTILVKVFYKGLYLYEENIYIKNNTFVIENLIYLNKCLLQEKEG